MEEIDYNDIQYDYSNPEFADNLVENDEMNPGEAGFAAGYYAY